MHCHGEHAVLFILRTILTVFYMIFDKIQLHVTVMHHLLKGHNMYMFISELGKLLAEM